MSVKFFLDSMNAAITDAKDLCFQRAASTNDPIERDAYTDMAVSFRPIPAEGYQNFEWGQVLPSFAVAEALLTMKMTDWETFYVGMAEWKRNAPRYPEPARAEEDVRGVMLMALADRCKERKAEQ